MPALDPALETFLELYCRYSHIRVIFDFSITSFRLLKRVPRNGFLTRSNRKKLQKAISGEFDGYWMVFVSFLVKNSRMALCDDDIMVQNPLHF